MILGFAILYTLVIVAYLLNRREVQECYKITKVEEAMLITNITFVSLIIVITILFILWL